MKLTRYTIQGKGIFHAMDYIDELVDRGVIGETEAKRFYRKGEDPFRDRLPAPKFGKGLSCWFTEYGLEYFARPLQIIIDTYERYIGIVDVVTCDYDGPAVYSDEYQVVIENNY